jgi:thioester reductase-like protein
MAIFLTGVTGFLGSFVVNEILERSDRDLQLLVRASSDRKALEQI